MYFSEILEHTSELLLFGALFALAERLRPVKRICLFNRDLQVDLLFSFLTAFAWPFFAALSIFFASSAVRMLGLQEPFLDSNTFIAQFLTALVVVDFIGYWRHRMMHTSVLWPVHEIHHSSSKMTWASLERFHPINSAITMSVNASVIAVLVNPEVGFLSLAARRIYGHFVHCNLKISYGPLDNFFVSPLVHHWHHCYIQQAHDKNFASIFSCIDRLFGTYYLPSGKSFPESTGLKRELKASLISQLLHPFKSWSYSLCALRKKPLEHAKVRTK